MLHLSSGVLAGCWYAPDVNGHAVVPEGITSIGDKAFYQCDSLHSIDLPNSVSSIGNRAFEYCGSLRSIVLLSNVTTIGYHAFGSCVSLASVSFAPQGLLTFIGRGAFMNCDSLASAQLPNGLTSLGAQAFKGTNINEADVTLPASVRRYWYWYNCMAFTDLVLPEGITSIGNKAFYQCDSLLSIYLPTTITSIGDEAFKGCASLGRVYVPLNCSVGNMSFDGTAYGGFVYGRGPPPSSPPVSPPSLPPPSPPQQPASQPTSAPQVDALEDEVSWALWTLPPLCGLLVTALVLIYRRHSRLSRNAANAILSRDRANLELQMITHQVETRSTGDRATGGSRSQPDSPLPTYQTHHQPARFTAKRASSLSGKVSLPPGPPSSSAGPSAGEQDLEPVRNVGAVGWCPGAVGAQDVVPRSSWLGRWLPSVPFADQQHRAVSASMVSVGIAVVAPAALFPLAAPISAASRLADGSPAPPVTGAGCTGSDAVQPALPSPESLPQPMRCAPISTNPVPPKAPAVPAAPPAAQPAKSAQLATSAYQTFCREQRPLLPTTWPNTEREAALGKMWKALSKAEKAKYQVGRTAYCVYCQEQRPLLPKTLRNTERERLLGTMWKALSATEKANYQGGDCAPALNPAHPTTEPTPARAPSVVRGAAVGERRSDHWAAKGSRPGVGPATTLAAHSAAAPAAPMLPADLGQRFDEPSASSAAPPTPSAAPPPPSADSGLEGLLNGVLEEMTGEEALEALLSAAP